MKKILIASLFAGLIMIASGFTKVSAATCPAGKECTWLDVSNVYDYDVPHFTSNTQNFYNDGATADHLCQMRGYQNYTYDADLGKYDRCNSEYSVIWQNGAWTNFSCTSSKWLKNIYCSRDANHAPTISWTSAPATAQCNASYTIEATGRDQDGNLIFVNVDRDGTAFAYAGGGDGYVGTSEGSPTDTGPNTITYTAWATDSNGAKSAVISHDIDIAACPLDMCPNIVGVQSSVPSGMEIDGSGNCVTSPVVTDVCPNIAGTQASVPSGMQIDGNGDCITTTVVPTDVCSNIPGVQTSAPANTTIVGGSCDCNSGYTMDGSNVCQPNAINHPPTGNFSAGCSAFTGSASDSDSPGQSVGIHFYVDGPAGSGSWGGNTSTDSSGNYSFATPSGLKNDTDRVIYAYAIDTAGGVNTYIGQSSINCSAPPVTNGNFTMSLGANPTHVPAAGGDVGLTWNASPAPAGTACVASGAWSGTKSASGSETVHVTAANAIPTSAWWHQFITQDTMLLFTVTCDGPQMNTGGADAAVVFDSAPAYDFCPNIAGTQSSVPSGLIVNSSGDCVTPPVTDVCPNIAGAQSSVPSGMTIDLLGNCVTPPVVTDLCPNISGTQASVPAGMIVDTSGDCVAFGNPQNGISYNSAPASVSPGQSITVTVTNNGTKTWGGGHELAISTSDLADNVALRPLGVTASGSQKVVSFTAPNTAGAYVFRAVEQGVEWFGGTRAFNVVATPPPSFCTLNPTDPSCVSGPSFCALHPTDPTCTTGGGGGGGGACVYPASGSVTDSHDGGYLAYSWGNAMGINYNQVTWSVTGVANCGSKASSGFEEIGGTSYSISCEGKNYSVSKTCTPTVVCYGDKVKVGQTCQCPSSKPVNVSGNICVAPSFSLSATPSSVKVRSIAGYAGATEETINLSVNTSFFTAPVTIEVTSAPSEFEPEYSFNGNDFSSVATSPFTLNSGGLQFLPVRVRFGKKLPDTGTYAVTFRATGVDSRVGTIVQTATVNLDSKPLYPGYGEF